MDPLSLTASIIAVGGVATQLLKKLHGLRNLSDSSGELHALINEVSDIQAIFQNIASIVRERETEAVLHGEPVANIAKYLESAKQKLLDLDTILRYRIVCYTDSGEIKASPLAWLRERGKIKAVQEELKGSRLHLMTQMAVLQACDISRVHLRLDEVTVVARDLANENKTFQSTATEQLERLFKEVSEIHVLSESHSQTQQMVTQLQQAIIQDEESSLLGTEQTTTTIIQRSSQNTIHHSGRREGHSSRSQVDTFSAVQVRTSHYWGMPCRHGCTCVCHKRHEYNTPRLLNQLIGSLFIGYSGLPIATPACNETCCRSRAVPSTQITYFFPQWFLQRAISFTMMMTPLDGPVATLRMQRAVSSGSKIWDYAHRGDVDGMKYLFQHGLASPHDVQCDSGVSALQINSLSESNRSAMDAAWSRILSKGSDPEKEREMRHLFNDSDCLEKRQFTRLHEVVLGLSTDNIEPHIEGPAIIDSMDSNGRTALSWAAARGDVKVVQKLLWAGANPNIKSVCGMVPLHFAVRPKSPRCIVPLLAFGAQVDFKTDWKQTPLHMAAAYQDDIRFIEPLLDSGADVNARDLGGNTPLGCAALSNHARAAVCLLDHGANINNQDPNGWTPLLDAVDCKSHIALRVLLQRGADWMLSLANGDTILHRAADRGDIRTINILTQARMAGVKVGARNDDGLIAEDLLRQRGGVGPEMASAFAALSDSIPAPESTTYVESGSAADDVSDNGDKNDEDGDINDQTVVFTDAVEYQAD